MTSKLIQQKNKDLIDYFGKVEGLKEIQRQNQEAKKMHFGSLSWIDLSILQEINLVERALSGAMKDKKYIVVRGKFYAKRK